MSRYLKKALMRARINDVRKEGDLYSLKGDIAAKRAAVRELKRAGFPTLTKEEIRQHRFKAEKVKNEKT